MKHLKNWDNKTWLSSTKYIFSFYKFLKSKVKICNETKILDIGCGRANIISFLQNKYKLKNKAIGIDIIRNKDTKKNIIFKKVDAINYLKKTNTLFDLILIKQTIHFFNKNELKELLSLIKKKLAPKGMLLILSLRIKQNELPTFKAMKKKLDESLDRDKYLIQIIKNKFVKHKKSIFKFKVLIPKKEYIKMLEKRYISCLLNLSKKEIELGIQEIQSKYNKKINFDDILDCLTYQN